MRTRTKKLDLLAYIMAQREWSGATFGPGPRTEGILRHIESEISEVRNAPNDLSEWVDIVILALDGAWRAGWTPAQIIEALSKKQRVNFAREWPAPTPEDQPNFHVGHKELT